jgi:hypothetical protein
MPPRHLSKHVESSDQSDNAYEMQPRGGKSTGETIVVEENESKYKGATANDRQDMARLGKTQELRVRCSATIRHSSSIAKPPV